MPLANFTEKVLYWNLAVVKDQRSGRRSADAELLLFRAHGEARKSTFHNECREFLAADLGKDDVEVRK